MPWLDSPHNPPVVRCAADDDPADRPAPGPDAWLYLNECLTACGRAVREALGRETGRGNLGSAEGSILWACRWAPPQGLSQIELARTLGLSPAHVSGLVERLRGQGLLEGHRPAANRRCQLWRLTSAGQTLCQARQRDLAPWAARMDERLGAQTLAEALRSMAEICRALRRQPEAPPTLADRKGAA